MPRLANPPLVEAIFELRWGASANSNSNVQDLQFSEDDQDFFPGEFHKAARDAGFQVVERPNVSGINIPHIVTHRFRKERGTWPCYQIGLGLFTANQISKGYSWGTFKTTILKGLNLLNTGHPKQLDGLLPVHVELRYRDGFLLDKGESDEDFVKKKLAVELRRPELFMDFPHFSGSSLTPGRITFEVQSNKPPSRVIVDLQKAFLESKPGYLLDTAVRSIPQQLPTLEIGLLEHWLDAAHEVQKHAFETLIDPSLAQTFESK